MKCGRPGTAKHSSRSDVVAGTVGRASPRMARCGGTLKNLGTPFIMRYVRDPGTGAISRWSGHSFAVWIVRRVDGPIFSFKIPAAAAAQLSGLTTTSPAAPPSATPRGAAARSSRLHQALYRHAAAAQSLISLAPHRACPPQIRTLHAGLQLTLLSLVAPRNSTSSRPPTKTYTPSLPHPTVPRLPRPISTSTHTRRIRPPTAPGPILTSLPRPPPWSTRSTRSTIAILMATTTTPRLARRPLASRTTFPVPPILHPRLSGPTLISTLRGPDRPHPR